MWILLLFILVLSIVPAWTLSLNSCKYPPIQALKLPVKNRTFYYWTISIPFILISSLRYPHLGTDTYAYEDIFNKIIHLENIFDFNLELGFTFITKLISFITTNFQIYLLIITTIFWYLQYLSFKKFSIDFRQSLWLLLLLSYLDISMSLIRQYFAIVILLNSYEYILNRKFFKFIILVGIASLFHKTALVFIISYFIYNIKIKKHLFLVFNILCIVSYFATNSIFDLISNYGGVYALYLGNSDFGIQESSKLASLLNFAVLYAFSAICIFERKIYEDKFAYHLMLMLLIATIITIPSFRLTQLSRVSFYFSSFLCFLLPIYFNMKSIRMKNFYMIIIYSALLLRYCVIAFFRPEWYGLYPYKFFFE